MSTCLFDSDVATFDWFARGIVEDACGDQIMSDATGIEGFTSQPLGCGGQGCVYEITWYKGRDDADLVFKITCDADEMRLAAWLYRQRDLPSMIPLVIGGWMLPCARGVIDEVNMAFGRGEIDIDPGARHGPIDVIAGLIIREDVADVSSNELKIDGGARIFGLQLGAWIEMGVDEKETDSLETIASYAEQTGREQLARDARDGAEVVEWALRNNIHLADLRTPNLGRRRNGELVIRDFGLGSSPSTETPAALRGRGRRRAPVVLAARRLY